MARASIAAPDAIRVREDRAIFRALRVLDRRLREPGVAFTTPPDAENYFRLRLAQEQREHFEVAFLDARHCLIATERLFSGSIDYSEVSPRIVVQRALYHNAAAVLIAHNHPSGNPAPSLGDKNITAVLRQALSMVEVKLLDHLIIGGRKITSLAMEGLL